MKNFLVSGLCAAVLVLFFACSNDGLDLKGPTMVAGAERVLCEWNKETPEYSCDIISEDICIATKGTVAQFCSGISSSSEPEPSSSSNKPGTSSSSFGGGSSSSNIASSSSGTHAYIVEGSLVFGDLNYESGSEKVYFIGKPIRLTNTVNITNAAEAKCGSITVELTRGSASITEANATDEAGEITASAYATCGDAPGTKELLVTAKANVAPNPTWAATECVPPSTYVLKNDPVKNLISGVINNNYGRCTDTDITYDPAAYPNVASITPTAFSTKASCPAITEDKNCQFTINGIADGYLKFNHKDDPLTVIPYTTTIVEFLKEGYNHDGTMKQAHKIECFGGEDNTSTTWGLKVNGGPEKTGYRQYQICLPSYADNDYKILVEKTTPSEIIKCRALTPSGSSPCAEQGW